MHEHLLVPREPSGARVFEQFFGRDRLIGCARQLRNHLRVVREPCQIGLGQSTIVLPPLHRRRSVTQPFCNRAEPNTFNRTCDGAHFGVSIHQLCKVASDQKCKHSASDLSGDTGHPHIVLGPTRGGQPRHRPPLRSFRYRARARRLAECRAEMARWNQLSLTQEYDYPSGKPQGKPRMALARRRTKTL